MNNVLIRAIAAIVLIVVSGGRPEGRLRHPPVGAGLEVGQALAFAQTPAQPQQQEEFIPIDQLPPQDQLPAAPLLVTAYSIVLLALFGYVFSVARRMGSVQREIERLESDMKRGSRAS
jgi:CcmD family protein